MYVSRNAERAAQLAQRQDTRLAWDHHNGWSYETRQGLAYEPDGSFWAMSAIKINQDFFSPGFEIKNNRRNEGSFCLIAPHLPIN